MNKPDRASPQIDPDLASALAECKDKFTRAATAAEAAREWRRERIALRDAFEAAATRVQRQRGEDFAATLGAAWWTALRALRDIAGITSMKSFALPRGSGYAVAIAIAEWALGPTGTQQGVVDRLRSTLPAMGVPLEEDAIAAASEEWPQVAFADGPSPLREIFLNILPMAFECLDRRWADRVPAAAWVRHVPLGVREGSSLPHPDAPCASAAPLDPPARATEASRPPWTTHHVGGQPLRGWLDIGLALGFKREEVAKKTRFLRRHNAATHGPILTVRARPQVDRGELLAWFADSRAQRDAAVERLRVNTAGGHEPGAGEPGRALELKLRIVESPRGGPTRLARDRTDRAGRLPR